MKVLPRVPVILLVVIFTGCSNKTIQYAHVPDTMKGKWIADTSQITVRTSPGFMKFDFHNGQGQLYLEINDSTANGIIGMSTFSNAPIIKNSGDPQRNGIAYIVRCDSIGKIFESDPLEQKQVSLELGPLLDNQMKTGLRYTQDGAMFPMSSFYLKRK